MDKEDLIEVLEDRVNELRFKGMDGERDWKKIDILEEVLFALKD